MGVISLGVLNKAQEITGKAFANNKVSEQNFEYVMLFSSVRMKSLFIFPCKFCKFTSPNETYICSVFPVNSGHIQCTFCDLHVISFFKKLTFKLGGGIETKVLSYMCV